MTTAIADFPTYDWSALLQQIIDQQSLAADQAEALMRGWLKEEIPPPLSGGNLGRHAGERGLGG